jgi:cbb3-type cytochrome oxidase subunit 1
MNIWLILGLPVAAVVFLLDYLLRRKKWDANTAGEKLSLIVNMVSVVPYMILSAFGVLMGIVGCSSETVLGNLIYDVTLVMGEVYFFVALAAVIGTLILRKIGKIKASIWINVISIAYIAVVAIVNNFAGVLL